MSNGMPWIRFHLYDWISGTDGMTLEQRGVYITLLVRMYDKKAPIKTDFETLARTCNCSKKKFATIIEYLIRDDKLIEIDGGLWNTRVEEELKDFADKKDYISQVRSEAGKKGAQAKSNIKQHVDNFAEENVKQNNNFAEAKIKQNVFFAEANDKQNQAIKNQNKNIYKKNKTIVLSKKEIGSENLETTDLVDEPIECDDVDSQSEQIARSSKNQPSIHEQESVPKKAKRVKTDRGCRLPADFEPDYDFALAEGLPPERIKIEIAKFQDYWNAKAGKDASKRDWQATWRNWVRNSKKYEINKQGGNYGNYTQKQKSIGERIADSILDIGNRGYFEAHSRDDSTGVSIGFERWQSINETAGSGCFRGW
ncbi:YdaU family protein [Bartonella acomydis]|uniref:Phage related protein n=1 Tax=Bartonella acomydis TaxID=686234 RepID=A0ABP9MI45_9HYPH